MNERRDEALNRLVVDADPNLVFIADADGRIVRVNARFMEYTGHGAEGFGSERGSALGIVHPEDLDHTWRSWKRALATGEPYQVSYRLRSARDGHYRWFLARALPARLEGKIVGWYGVATDVHDQVRASERSRFLSEAAAALGSSLEPKRIIDAFLGVAIRRFSDGCIIALPDAAGTLQRVAVAHRDPEVEARARDRIATMRVEESSVLARVCSTKRSVLVPDALDETRTGWLNADGVQIARTIQPTRSVLTVPLLLADRVTGAITFVSSGESPPFDEYDRESAEAAARQAATAFEHATIFNREREATERFRFLAHTTDQLFATPDLNENLEVLVQSMVGYWADRAILYVLEPEGGVRAHAIAYSEPRYSAVEEYLGQRIFNEAGEARFRDVLAKRRSWLRSDVTRESLREVLQPWLYPTMEHLHPQSLLIVPLFTSEYEFGALGVYLAHRNYTEEEREMFEELGRRISIAIEHGQSVMRERRLARTLQEITLPATLASIPGAVLSTAYGTATISDAPVGGDWYDAFELPDGKTVLSIGDVTGSGLQASAIMGKLRHAINALAMYEPDPARVLDAAEFILLQRYPEAVATAFVVILDSKANRISYANAGHPHPFVRMWNGANERLDAQGLPVGSRMLSTPAASRSRSLDDVAMLVFYTDGVTEATRDVEAGERLLTDVLSKEGVLYVRSPATFLSETCVPEGPRDDDAALMVVSFPRAIGWSFEAENARAAQAARGAFVQCLREEATPESDFAGAEIVFGELVGNVVRHAPGSIDVALEWHNGRAVLHVVDRGPGFEYGPPAEVDLLSEGGRGLWLAHQFGEHVRIERLGRFGAHVCVTLPVWQTGRVANVSAGKPKRARAAASGRG